jgi:hypothetical protein
LIACNSYEHQINRFCDVEKEFARIKLAAEKREDICVQKYECEQVCKYFRRYFATNKVKLSSLRTVKRLQKRKKRS